MNLNPAVQKNVQAWLEGPYDEQTKQELRELLKTDPVKVADAFYTQLTFGTGGLRALMGIGTNRLNGYTIRTAAQGVAAVLKKESPSPSVCVGYDSRLNSRYFAEETAKVLAGNGCKVYFFKELRPSPLVSFGVRHLHCTAGIMITASHNPPAYNGFKVFWGDGAQVLAPYDKEILAEIQKVTSPLEVKMVPKLDHRLIEQIDLDKAYLKRIDHLRLHPAKTDIKVVYTSLHGTGVPLVPQALKQAGFGSVTLVEEQVIPDGKFNTCPNPNPEDPHALDLGIRTLKATQGDLLIATDPDTDRMGAAVWHKGKVHLLSGNQIACICLYTLLNDLKMKGALPPQPACIKTLATTELFRKICEDHQCLCIDVLTGFKYIAEKIREWDQQEGAPQFIFGGEESFGYLLGNNTTRDKDGITVSVLLAEAAAFAKEKGLTLIGLMDQIYQKYGYFLATLTTLDFPETLAGRQTMAQKIAQLETEAFGKNLPLKNIVEFPKNKTFVLHFQDDTTIIIRPSGTEPKIKIYCEVHQAGNAKDLEQKAQAALTQVLDALG